MSWASHLANSEEITAIYGEAVPLLDRVRIHEVGLDYERGLLRLRFDLAGFPENPPRKWAGSNVVQLEIQAAGVRSIDFRGDLPGEPHVCRVLFQSADWQDVRLESESFTLGFQAQGTTLTKISAYLDEIPFEG